jgi:hypothetical protein
MRTSANHRHRRTAAAPGPEGNEHLTAMTAAVLLVGFAVEGATILELHRLLWLHFAVGFLLIGPVLLKIGSTIYRFARYYGRSEPYLRKGPPAPLLRVLGPLVILTSVAVLATGVVLAVAGPGHGNWLFLHKASFVLWFGVMTVHVVAYAPRLPRLLVPGLATGPAPGSVVPARAPGAPARYLALSAALAGGIAVAALAVHLSSQWNGGVLSH